MTHWPMYPQPFEGELFSSWIFRVARANGQTVRSLMSIVDNNKKNICSNLDNSISKDILNKLNVKLRISYSSAFNTTLQSYEGVLFEKTTIKVLRKSGILYRGDIRKKIKRYPQQFCPVCLSDGEPYYLKIWRVSFVTVCVRHNTLLLDRCPNCLREINFIKHDLKPREKFIHNQLAFCSECDFDLRKAHYQTANRSVIKATKFYLEVLKKGYVILEKNKWEYSFTFFYVLRLLMNIVIDINEVLSRDIYKNDIDGISLKERYFALQKLANIFSEWPQTLVNFCVENNIQYSNLKPLVRTRLPYWLDCIAKAELYSPNIEPSEREVKSAIEYMLNNGQALSITKLNLIMGFSDSNVIKKVLKCYQAEKNFYLPYMREQVSK